MNRFILVFICCCSLWMWLRGNTHPPTDVLFASCEQMPVRQQHISQLKPGVARPPLRTSWVGWNLCGVAAGGVLAAFAGKSKTISSQTCLHRRGKPSATACFAAGSDVGVVLLSAGVGKRMGASIPKQYIKLMGLEIALHSLDTFLDCDVAEIVIVCAEDWQYIFKDHLEKKGSLEVDVKFTTGGKERQDSVNNGLAKIEAPIVAIHDAARPLVTKDEIEKVVTDAREHGAALLAVRTKATIKQAVSESEAFVEGTPKRKLLWEAHTPQVIRSELLRKGFEKAEKEGLDVTDDVSLIEQLGEKVKLTEGEYTNIKVTTPEDIAVAETILKERGFVAPAE
ncbi:ISPD [Symbiodinium pilosum]|uniref:2-C-methyl-D-erythritol 4-phosphate cytidylyltransferase, chloroplastic n=1 Tax=Symbiodinium pilosum TaxID=2952 RepID=A0A812T5T1_SYMPI|nr:ISPD [Symbiodinium pilosum]